MPITNIPVIGYPDYTPYTQVTPFTVRDGATYLLTLEALKDWIRDVLVPSIDTNISGLETSWETQTSSLVDQTNAIVADLIQQVDAAITDMQSQVDAATAAQTAAEAARDQAEEYASTVVAIQDTAVTGLINDGASTTRVALNGIFATIDALNAQTARINSLVTLTSNGGRLGADTILASDISRRVSGRGVVYMADYPRTGGETDDSAALGRAIADAATRGAHTIELGADIHLVTQVNVNTDYLTIRSGSKTGTTINFDGDVNCLFVTGNYVAFENVRFYNSVAPRTVFPILFSGANQGRVSNCYFDSITGGRFTGVRFTGGSMGIVENCTMNHSCIRIETWDVKIRNCWIWGMSNDYCIGIFNGAGNTDIANVDIVPPLHSTATGIAGILLDGTSGVSINTKMNMVYLDGNPSLDTGKGILARGGCGGINIMNVTANQMDDDAITIDSCYSVEIIGYNGYNNNRTAGHAGREIVITKTGAQGIESVRLVGISCLMTTAALGTVSPAIYVDDSVGAGQVSLDGFNIKQPGAGGGYSSPEVRVPKDANGYPTMSMHGKGQLTHYTGKGSQLIPNGNSTTTINLGDTPFAMAYRPDPSQIQIGFLSSAVTPNYRITYNSDNQILLTFSAAMTADTTVYWSANLRR